MTHDRNYSAVANWTIAVMMIFGGTVLGAGMLLVVLGNLLFSIFGNPILFAIGEAELKILYGLLALAVLHVVTRGWWLSECVREFEEARARHEAATGTEFK